MFTEEIQVNRKAMSQMERQAGVSSQIEPLRKRKFFNEVESLLGFDCQGFPMRLLELQCFHNSPLGVGNGNFRHLRTPSSLRQ